jgi:pimeloyl-ACP methyl ester carboxylesterase
MMGTPSGDYAGKESLSPPTSRYFYSQRLKLHYVEWGNADEPLLLLIHGGRDHARSWDWLAADLRGHFHIVAPDLRGHGDSQWSIGGAYELIDYTLDLAQLLDLLGQFPVQMIGHSLGGAVALQYAGTFPERVAKLVAIESVGPPSFAVRDAPAPQRMRDWIAAMQTLARRSPPPYETLEEAVARMRRGNPRLTADQARHLTVHGTYRDEQGRYLWKFDNQSRAVSPHPFNLRDATELWRNIACPVLLFRGMESWVTDPEKDGRTTAFRNCRMIHVPDASHWVHHDQFEVFRREVGAFLGV